MIHVFSGELAESAAMAFDRYGIPISDAERIAEEFKRWDTDGSGYIDASESVGKLQRRYK